MQEMVQISGDVVQLMMGLCILPADRGRACLCQRLSLLDEEILPRWRGYDILTSHLVSSCPSCIFPVTPAGAENPTYLKEPGDRIVFGIAFSGMLLGTSCILKGLYDMSYGVNKLKH